MLGTSAGCFKSHTSALPADSLPSPHLGEQRAFLHRIPVRTIFDSHPGGGVAAIAISRDARYLVTISSGRVQVRKILPPLCFV